MAKEKKLIFMRFGLIHSNINVFVALFRAFTSFVAFIIQYMFMVY